MKIVRAIAFFLMVLTIGLIVSALLASKAHAGNQKNDCLDPPTHQPPPPAWVFKPPYPERKPPLCAQKSGLLKLVCEKLIDWEKARA